MKREERIEKQFVADEKIREYRKELVEITKFDSLKARAVKLKISTTLPAKNRKERRKHLKDGVHQVRKVTADKNI
jgi:hypothetical protein